MSQKKIDILERALAREKSARKQAEKILEKKSAELYELTIKLSRANSDLESSVDLFCLHAVQCGNSRGVRS